MRKKQNNVWEGNRRDVTQSTDIGDCKSSQELTEFKNVSHYFHLLEILRLNCIRLCFQWFRLWLAFTVSTLWSRHIDAQTQDGAAFGWGWQLSPQGTASTVGHYYVKLPQSEQQVRYSAEGYSGAGAAGPALSLQAQPAPAQGSAELQQQAQNIYDSSQTSNTTQLQAPPSGQQPVDIYLLQQQYNPYQQNAVLPTPDTVQTTSNYGNNYQSNQNDNSKPLQKEDYSEYRDSVLQVFKNHNCSDNDNSEEIQNDLKKSKDLFAEVPSYDIYDINNFGATSYPYTYRGAVKFRVEAPRPNARNERYYYTTIETPTTQSVENNTEDGIGKLVASTQDLISNDDLLRINHAAEKHVHEQSEDIIKPRPRYTFRNNDHSAQDSRNTHFTIKAKISNIIDKERRTENNQQNDQFLRQNANQYDFASPIVVQDTSYNNFKEQIVDNLVSTMVPYMANGYQIVGVKDRDEENPTDQETKEENQKLINVTPRPVNQKYLAPITVALRLLNANDSELFNTLDDHEASDSELVSDTVQSPPREKTTVEIQESIPVEITHINDVEVHEYIDFDEGRSNNKGPFDVAKSLYNKYVDALRSSKQMQDNMNKLLHKYGALKDDGEKSGEDYDSKEQLEQSENIQRPVEVKPNQEDTQAQTSQRVRYYDYRNDNKIIQPIIIEKEVPITKFVDRFIEKKVPYPQQVEVKVPVDRPVPVPVPYEKIVEKPVEVTKYVDKPYPVDRPYPVEVKVPYPVEQKVYVDRPVHVPYPIEKVVEKQVIHPVPIPTPVGIPYEVPVPVEHKILYPVPIDRPVPVTVEIEKPVERIVNREIPVPYPVEKRVPYPVHHETRVPVPYPVEKRVPYPVEKIVEKPVMITKYVDKPIHIEVPVPQPVPIAVHVPQPYPVDRIVERKVPYPVHVDRIVEKKVPYHVPYPVEKIVEKIVEKPVIVTKYIDKPYPVEKKVPYPVEKIVEKKIPYPVQVPFEVKVPYPFEKPNPNAAPVYRFNQHEIDSSETKSNAQYYKDDRNKRIQNQQQQQQQQQHQQQQQNQIYIAQYYQLLKERQRQSQQPVQSTQWGNQYASSYQYINNTSGSKHQEEKKNNLANFLSYVTNGKSNSNQYYGPVPTQNQDDWWQNNKNYIVEVKMRRADREPKFTNLRIEYGGFKPPLIPSTEVDLDGIPINKES
ncbi:uncharacterized protein LOC113505050 [Trichoplusia ni]|uniref:Uncharacterized protein LOC113505050 n=1 Tax=Trichoplusia ni TaxID=7111 RepID=A0A7E5WST5_TRINI|nr:uncharacterized protein LOC113505050 [Trichoplusia ni]